MAKLYYDQLGLTLPYRSGGYWEIDSDEFNTLKLITETSDTEKMERLIGFARLMNYDTPGAWFPELTETLKGDPSGLPTLRLTTPNFIFYLVNNELTGHTQDSIIFLRLRNAVLDYWVIVDIQKSDTNGIFIESHNENNDLVRMAD